MAVVAVEERVVAPLNLRYPDCFNRLGDVPTHKVMRVDGGVIRNKTNNVKVKCIHCKQELFLVRNTITGEHELVSI